MRWLTQPSPFTLLIPKIRFMDLKFELSKILTGDVVDDQETLLSRSTDASIFQVKPSLVVYPKDSADVKKLVKFVAARKAQGEKISLTARSAGTDMSGGPLTSSIVVDFTRYFNRIKEVGDGYAVVEPGVYYRDFEKATLKKNLLMPSFPASREICAVGGMVANNSGGEKSLRYGKTENFILALKVVLADGNEYEIRPLTEEELNSKLSADNFEGRVYRQLFDLIKANYSELQAAKPNVTKNSAGYFLWNVWDKDKKVFDLTKLFVGSQGTLGLITEIKFRLIRPEPHSRLLVVFLKTMDVLPSAVEKLLMHNPETLESYDDKTLALVFRYFFSFAKLMGWKNLFRLIWNFRPEAKLVLSGGLPKLILLAEFSGKSEAEVVNAAKAAASDLKNLPAVKTHLTKSKFEARKYWKIRREAFNLIRYHLKKKKSEPFVDDIIVRPEKLTELFPALYKILNAYGDKMTFAVGGHSGDGNMHIYTLISPQEPRLRDIVLNVSRQVYSLVIGLKGSITAEHNDGLIRSPFLKQMYGERIFGLFEEVKKIFDAANIFNPGKKVNADLDYALNHLKRQNG